MGKSKITSIESIEDTTPRLKPQEYWEWRTTVTEMDLAKQKFISATTELKLLHKEAEILAVRSQLFQKSRLEGAKLEYEKAQVEFQRFSKVIEDRLGMSLKNKVIDDVTFEIRDLPEPITAPDGAKGH